MSELISDLDDEIKREMPRLVDDRHYADQLSEMVDGWVPDNHGELADLLCSDNSLASVDDPELLNQNPTVWDIIQLAVRENLLSNAMQEFQNLKDAFEEDKEEMEEEGLEIEARGRKNGGGYRIIRPADLDDADSTEEVIKDDIKTEYEAVQWWLANGE